MSTDKERAAVARAMWWGLWGWPSSNSILSRRVEALEIACKRLAEPSVPVPMSWVEKLSDRVEALEAAAAQLVPAAEPAPSGVSVDELADCLPANAWAGPEGYSRQAFARHLLDHPRIGPLLRGEGAPAPKRVVLPEKPFYPFVVQGGAYYMNGFDDAWATARAEVERQQQEVGDG